VKAFREHGEEALAAKPRTGHPRLSAEQEAIVLGWLKRNPTEFGFGTELWTAGRITILIERNFQVKFNSHYVSAWLAARGVSSQKPQRVPRERNQETIDRWVREEWPRIQKKARDQQAHIVLIDETGLLMAPLVRRTLAMRGETPVIRQKGAHRDRVSVIAALSYTWRGTHPCLYFQTRPKGSFNSEAVRDFVHELLRQIRGPLIAVWDQANIHKGPHLRNLMESFPRLSAEPLAPWAPQLNPVESLWNYLKYDELANFAPINVPDLNERVIQELQHTSTDRTRLTTFDAMSDLPLRQATLAS
jgi:transposase